MNGEKDARGAPNVVIGANDPATLAGMRLALEADGIAVSAEVHSLQELVEAVERAMNRDALFRPKTARRLADMFEQGFEGAKIASAGREELRALAFREVEEARLFELALRERVRALVPTGAEQEEVVA